MYIASGYKYQLFVSEYWRGGIDWRHFLRWARTVNVILCFGAAPAMADTHPVTKHTPFLRNNNYLLSKQKLKRKFIHDKIFFSNWLGHRSIC